MVGDPPELRPHDVPRLPASGRAAGPVPLPGTLGQLLHGASPQRDGPGLHLAAGGPGTQAGAFRLPGIPPQLDCGRRWALQPGAVVVRDGHGQRAADDRLRGRCRPEQLLGRADRRGLPHPGDARPAELDLLLAGGPQPEHGDGCLARVLLPDLAAATVGARHLHGADAASPRGHPVSLRVGRPGIGALGGPSMALRHREHRQPERRPGLGLLAPHVDPGGHGDAPRRLRPLRLGEEPGVRAPVGLERPRLPRLPHPVRPRGGLVQLGPDHRRGRILQPALLVSTTDRAGGAVLLATGSAAGPDRRRDRGRRLRAGAKRRPGPVRRHRRVGRGIPPDPRHPIPGGCRPRASARAGSTSTRGLPPPPTRPR